MNEAAIMAARRSKDKITFSEIDYAIDRLTVGLAKTTGMNNPARQRLVAYHEAGHGVMAALIPGFDTVAKLTIIPRSNGAGGFTLFTPDESSPSRASTPSSSSRASSPSRSAAASPRNWSMARRR